jgi:hypothetical protein
MTSEQGTFTTTTEVVELASATLDAPLFDMPAGCHVMDMSALMGKAPHADATPEPTPTATAAKTPEAAPAPPAPTLAPKTAGVMRIGVVKIKDLSGQGLPTENLLVNLLSEFSRQQLEPVVLDADSPQQSVEAEARAKQCDYFVYTVAHQVTDPGSEGLTGPTVPKAAKLDHAKYQALSGVTLYKVGKPLPEIKDLSLAADAAQFAVDAVTATFVMESDKVAAQIADDAHPKSSKAPAKPAAAKPKTK